MALQNLHIKRIQTYLKQHINDSIDMADCEMRNESERENALYSRALAAYSLIVLTQCSISEAASCITDGFGDNGIDAIYFDKYTNKLWIVQSKFFFKGSGSISHGDMLKFIKGLSDLLNGDFDQFNDRIKNRKNEIESILSDYKVTVQIVNASTGQPISKECKKSIDDLLDELNTPTEIAYFHDFNLRHVEDGLISSVEGTPIDVDVVLTEWGMIEEPYKAVYGLMSGTDLVEWWKMNGKRLFSDNIRSFLGASDVNENIADTIENHPENFVYFNNGITILCKSLNKKPLGGKERRYGHFTCKDISIVNGAQTLGTIGSVFEKLAGKDISLSVFVKIISLENATDNLGEQITIATNTQNKVEKKDFVSLDEQQIRLRQEFALEGITYHIKRTSEKISLDDKNYNVEEATLALATKADDVGLSVQAKREIGKLWEDRLKKPYTELFNSQVSALNLIKAIKVYRKVSDELKKKVNNAYGRERSIYVYGNLFITHLVFRLIPSHAFEGSLDFDQYLETNITNEIPQIIQKVYDKTMELYPNSMIPQLFRNHTKCKDIKDKLNITIKPLVKSK